MSLYAAGSSAGAERKYLNHDERQRVLATAARLDIRPALFALTLTWTGARISEVLALAPRSFQVERSIVAFVTLKQRRWVVREVPIPPELMQAITKEFDLIAAQQDPARCFDPLWPMHRVTAWRLIKSVMVAANIAGRSACPRGLRHAFGVGALQAGVPVMLLQRWLGHARLSTTQIYAEVVGPEEMSFAERFWTSRI